MKCRAVGSFGKASAAGWLASLAGIGVGLLLANRLAAAEGLSLKGQVPPAVAHCQAIGRLPSGRPMHLAIGLPLRNPGGLTNLLAQIYNPASTNYHHFLTPAQFTERFGPTPGDYQGLADFVRARGLTITATHANRMLLEVAGPADRVEPAFHVTLRRYRHPVEARDFYAPDTEPVLDLAVPVLSVSGLDNYQVPHPASLRKITPDLAPPARPLAGSGPGGNYIGNDFRTAYVPGTPLTGRGEQVGLVEFSSGFYLSDVTNYENLAGLPPVPVTTVLLDNYDGGPGLFNDECSLDVEMAVSMAPGLSQVVVYEGVMPDDVLNRMATDDSAEQLASSWTFPIDPTTEQIFMQFAAQGQSFFNASGDSDAYAGAIPSPCDDPNITIVGGTTLTTAADGSWQSEQVWNEGNGSGSGGGISTQYPIPVWQQAVNMATNQGSITQRNIPDVALTADNILVMYNHGSSGSYTGTSCAAPLWAAFTALINEQGTNNAAAPVGFLNPAIYALGAGTNYPQLFHDIVTGDNTWSGSTNQFYAVPGYDLCTGWGTPAGQSLIDALVGPAAPVPPLISTQPQSQTNASGTTVTFSVVATGSAPLSYQWSFDGTNLDGAVGATLTLTNVQSDEAGDYTVGVTNAFGGSQSSNAILTVAALPPTILVQPVNQTNTAGLTASFNVSAAGSLPLSYQWTWNGTNVAGGTNATLVLTAVQPDQAGIYEVWVTNEFGTVLSSNAVLSVALSSPCATAPAGLVSWWPGEGDTGDIFGTNNGVPGGGLDFTNAEVGLGFWFDSTNASVRIPAGASLNVGTGGGFTVEGWINCAGVTQPNPLFEWNTGTGPSPVGVQFYVWSDGSLYGNVVDTGGDASLHGFFSRAGLLTSNVFYHVALTYDKAAGVEAMYLNGTLVARESVGEITPLTSYDLYLGWGSPTPGQTDSLAGILDEPTLYDRALSASELQAIYAAAGTGKCAPFAAPVITAQPANELVATGADAIFGVTVTGASPFAYQWFFNNNPLPAATNASLTVPAVQTTNEGNYSVLVTNFYGAVLSSNAMLRIRLLDHFIWSPIASPQFVNAPFTVTLQAQTAGNELFTNFTGEVNLTTTLGIPVTPAVSGAFSQGSWTGTVAVTQAGLGLVLEAQDKFGDPGLANAIDVVTPRALSLATWNIPPDGVILQVYWPADPGGFVLETTTALDATNWVPVTTPPQLIGNEFWEVALPLTDASRFFRLRQATP